MINDSISVIIPYFNHIKYIDECLKSIRDQAYQNIEIVIVNDLSTDGSKEYLERIKKMYNFKLVNNEQNVGCSASIEIGFQHSLGDFICVLASDDLFVKNRFPRQLEIIKTLNCDVLYGNSCIFEDLNNKYTIPNLDEFISAYGISREKLIDLICTQDYNLPLLQSAIFKRNVFKELQILRNKFKSDDWVLLINSFVKFNACFENIPTFIYRLHLANSHHYYWKLLSNRFEVISEFTPINLRDKAFSNILISLFDYKFSNNEYHSSMKFAFASLLINFRFRNCILIFKKVLKKIFNSTL